MRTLFVDHHPALGIVPGPGRLATRDGQIWLAGGGRGDAALWSFTDVWHSVPIDAHGLRDVLPLDEDAAIVCGERGYLAFVRDGDPTLVEIPTEACLYALADDRAGTIWIGSDDGLWRMTPDGRSVRRVPSIERRVARVAIAPDGVVWLATATGLARSRDRSGVFEDVLATSAPLTDLAFAPDGTLAVTGDAGQLYLASSGAKPTRRAIALLARRDLECVTFDPQRETFVIGGDRGWVGTLDKHGGVAPLSDVDPPYRVTSVVAHGGGLLCAGWTQHGPPFTMRGALYFEGEAPPEAVAQPPRQDLPPRRERTFVPSGPALALDDALDLSIEDARRRLPDVAWPETELERVRFFDGDLHVRGSRDLLDPNNERGYAVAIAGDLVVDGVLDAVAGGDGYDSVLVVAKNAWAEAAIFRYGIKASIGGALEVATVLVCSHGDDGGTLSASAIRAQVLSYSLYFPRPEAVTIDAFCIGDVYGEESFDPERANEVFVNDVLDEGGVDERALANALRAGTSVLR